MIHTLSGLSRSVWIFLCMRGFPAGSQVNLKVFFLIAHTAGVGDDCYLLLAQCLLRYLQPPIIQDRLSEYRECILGLGFWGAYVINSVV